MSNLLVRSVAVAAVVIAASVASASPGFDASGLSMSDVAGGFARSGAPILLLSVVGFAGRRQREWYDCPEVRQDLKALPSLPQDYTYFPR